jgi:hypothetical protein
MIDYRANIAALDTFRLSLQTSVIAGGDLSAARDSQLAAVAKEPGMAMLGALVNHLMWHAASDGAELALVERAAELWRTGMALYGKLGEFRHDLEQALVHPNAPDAVQRFDAAWRKRSEFEAAVFGKELEVNVLGDDIYAAALPDAHPRQRNQRLDQWGWGDIFLARHTDAFCHQVWQDAADDRQKAFAFGVMSSYGANVFGSAYLGQVVGGPRRAHRHRDRMARNAVGSSYALTHPQTRSLSGIAAQIRYGLFSPQLPAAVASLVSGGVAALYDLSRVPPLPDLQTGYTRMLRHLDALDTFKMPPKAALPPQPLLGKIYGDTANPSFSVVEAIIEIKTASPPGSGGGGGVKPQNKPGSGNVGQQDSRRNSKLDCGAFFEGLARFIAGTGVLWGPCWEDWGNGRHCKLWDDMEDNFADWWASLGGGQGAGEPTGTTGQMLATAANSQQVIDLVHSFYDLHNYFWEVMNSAYVYLCRTGMIYPDELLDRPLYRQFLQAPNAMPGAWPHTPSPFGPDDAHLYPQTSIEQAAVMTQAFHPGALPAVFLGGEATGGGNASQLSMAVWRQAASRTRDAGNYDLDADRGLRHACWRTKGSIDDNPVNVVVLNYSET